MTEEQVAELNRLIKALHAFAQDTGALAGDNVLKHFEAKWDEWRKMARSDPSG